MKFLPIVFIPVRVFQKYSDSNVIWWSDNAASEFAKYNKCASYTIDNDRIIESFHQWKLNGHESGYISVGVTTTSFNKQSSCVGKVAFDNKQLAKQAAGRRAGRSEYKCPHCNKYDVGHSQFNKESKDK